MSAEMIQGIITEREILMSDMFVLHRSIGGLPLPPATSSPTGDCGRAVDRRSQKALYDESPTTLLHPPNPPGPLTIALDLVYYLSPTLASLHS